MTKEEVDAVANDVLRANALLISRTGCAAERIKLSDEIALNEVYALIDNEICIHPDAWEQIRKEYPVCDDEEWTEGGMLWGIPVER